MKLDTSANLGQFTTPTQTTSYTCSGVNRLLTVWVQEFNNSSGSTSSQVSGVTYGGVALTQIGTYVTVPGQRYYLTGWYLINPASGANNIVITQSGASNIFTDAVAASYKNVVQSSSLDVNGANSTVGATSLSESVTTTTGGDWLVGGCTTTAGTLSGGTGTTIRQVSSSTNFASIDSNNSVGIGSESLSVSFGASQPAALIVAAFKGLAEGNALFFGQL